MRRPACTTRTVPTTSSSATVHLPKTVTLAAPVTATYGYRYSIGGTGRSGDVVNLQSLATTVPARGSTMVKPDGTFVIRATLRSIFTDDGDLAMSARGRYAVASVEGGNATVYGIAAQDTHVVLAQPRFVLQRKTGGKLLHFSVRIPGADHHVRVAIKLGSKTLATGYATKSGTFSKTILKPSRARQPARRRLGARRRHGDLERHAAQPLGLITPHDTHAGTRGRPLGRPLRKSLLARKATWKALPRRRGSTAPLGARSLRVRRRRRR